MRVAALLLLASMLGSAPGDTCVGLDAPVDGQAVREFAPVGRYGGHWGIDFAVAAGTPVRAADHGVVTFSGVVAGMETVTVDHGGGLRTSYSHLAARAVVAGDPLARGGQLGTSGLAHGHEAVHFSVRIDGRYVDPRRVLGCVSVDMSRALRLVAVR